MEKTKIIKGQMPPSPAHICKVKVKALADIK
jgi:hypothetical protein